MITKTIKQEKNPFLEREEITLEIKNEVAPSYEEIKTELGKDANLTVIKRVNSNFGKQVFTAEVVVYDSKEAKEKIETIPQKVRKKMAEEKKTADEAAKKAAAEEAKVAEAPAEEAKAAETPTEEPAPVTEEAPVEEPTPEPKEEPKKETKEEPAPETPAEEKTE